MYWQNATKDVHRTINVNKTNQMRKFEKSELKWDDDILQGISISKIINWKNPATN